MTSAQLRRRLADNIQRICEETDRSLNSIADHSGIGRGSTHRIARAETNVTLATLAKLADHLGVDPAGLIAAPKK